jgi:Ca-activated chloride channel homolog
MSGLTWLEPQWIWLLIPAAAVAGLRGWELGRRRRDLARFSDPRLFGSMNPGLRAGWGAEALRGLAFFLGLSLLVLAAARPAGQPEAVAETASLPGVDIMLAVDLSSSMKAADLAPTRIQAAKTAVKDFIDRLATDRVGLTVFAGSVSLQCPLTLDYRTAKMMVDIINTDFLPLDGTALGDALSFALEKIGKADQQGAVIILLTDGENTRGQDPLAAAAQAKAAGVRVYTVGIGTPGGATIPDGADAAGRPKVKMYQGRPVVTKLDEETLKRIAEQTGGKYYFAQSSQALLAAYADISQLTKAAHSETKQTFKYRELYLWPLLAGLLCLLFDTFAGVRLPRRSGTVAG